jgi:hypothetical protein
MEYPEAPGITLKTLLDEGILPAGILLHPLTDSTIPGTLMADGSIRLQLGNSFKDFPSPSGAARAIGKRSLNGWLFWQVMEGQSLYNLAHYRKLYYARKEK